MKFAKTLLFAAPICLAVGCVQSHRPTTAAVYSPPPPSTPSIYAPPPPVETVVVPTSPRPDVRVYAPDSTVPPPFEPVITYGSSESDMALAQSIRRTLSADASLAAAARNMRMSVLDGRVTLTGTTPSENARQLVERTVATTAGVVSVDNRAQVELH